MFNNIHFRRRQTYKITKVHKLNIFTSNVFHNNSNVTDLDVAYLPGQQPLIVKLTYYFVFAAILKRINSLIVQMYVKWVRRLEKCVTAKGEYFEKNWKNCQRHDVVSVKMPRTYDGIWVVCICLTCSVYASCVKKVCDLQTFSFSSATFYDFGLVF